MVSLILLTKYCKVSETITLGVHSLVLLLRPRCNRSVRNAESFGAPPPKASLVTANLFVFLSHRPLHRALLPTNTHKHIARVMCIKKHETHHPSLSDDNQFKCAEITPCFRNRGRCGSCVQPSSKLPCGLLRGKYAGRKRRVQLRRCGGYLRS